jgi:glucose/arabinose dehydrogenase
LRYCLEPVGADRQVIAQQATEELPAPCDFRPTRLNQPWMRSGLSCLEEVINDPDGDELAFTSLAAAPDGTLYAARPQSGEIFAFTDTDEDGVPESPRVVAEELTMPNGLDYYEDALYIAGGAHVYRLRDGELETLIDDLSAGNGFWTGGIAVGDDDERIYVATGAPCDFCAFEDPARGAVLSFALDGSDRQIVATGLRHPADITSNGSDLWVVDSAREGLFDTPELDEVNRVQPDANFGFPYCVGANVSDGLDGICEAATPVVALPTGSMPTGIAVYHGDVIPSLEGKLLVALSGSYNDLDLRGYMVLAADPQTGAYEPLMPARPDDGASSNFTTEEMNTRGSGFFPRRPLDVAVTEQGWIYISVSGGRILLMRP